MRCAREQAFESGGRAQTRDKFVERRSGGERVLRAATRTIPQDCQQLYQQRHPAVPARFIWLAKFNVLATLKFILSCAIALTPVFAGFSTGHIAEGGFDETRPHSQLYVSCGADRVLT